MKSQSMLAVIGSLGGALAAAGCTPPNNSGSTLAACRVLPTAATAQPRWSGTVFTIVMENKSRHEILGSGSAPFVNQLARANASAGGYHDNFVHPSEANYL